MESGQISLKQSNFSTGFLPRVSMMIENLLRRLPGIVGLHAVMSALSLNSQGLASIEGSTPPWHGHRNDAIPLSVQLA